MVHWIHWGQKSISQGNFIPWFVVSVSLHHQFLDVLTTHYWSPVVSLLSTLNFVSLKCSCSSYWLQYTWFLSYIMMLLLSAISCSNTFLVKIVLNMIKGPDHSEDICMHIEKITTISVQQWLFSYLNSAAWSAWGWKVALNLTQMPTAGNWVECKLGYQHQHNPASHLFLHFPSCRVYTGKMNLHK